MEHKPAQNSSPLVSVIVPTFNRRAWIEVCLDSILEQSYPKIEIIVVDDGSNDGTAEWIRSKREYAGVTVHVQENSGASVARNNGIKLATGELIVFIDSDDMLLPNHIEKAVGVFNEFPETGIFCCDSRMIDTDGAVLFDGATWHQNLSSIKKLRIESGFRPLEDVFRFSNCFPGFTLRREVFDELGGFDQSIFPADDYDLALRVAGSRWKVFYLHEPLCLRREHDGQCSGIQNSVKTCRKLTEALNRVLAENPELLRDRALVNSRLGEIELELGMSQIKEGGTASGLKTMAKSMIRDPQQAGRIAGIGSRKLKNLAFGEKIK